MQYYIPIEDVLRTLNLNIRGIRKKKRYGKKIIWFNPTMSKYGPIPLSYVFYIYNYDRGKTEIISSHSLTIPYNDYNHYNH